jgi:hypothetical protein
MTTARYVLTCRYILSASPLVPVPSPLAILQSEDRVLLGLVGVLAGKATRASLSPR